MRIKMFLTLALIIQFLFLVQYQGFSKPYQPQVMGGFKSSTATDYRYEPGSTKIKSIEKTYTTIYDANGNPVELISYENNKEAQRIKISNKYNSKGLLIETVYFDAAGNPVKYTYDYDDKSNKISDYTYNSNGLKTAKSIYKYDNNNFLIQAVYYVILDDKELITNTINYTNDAKGNPIVETTVQNDSSSMSVKYIYKYDEKDNIIRSERYSFDNYKFLKEYKYDKYGNITEQLYFDDNEKPALKTVFEYAK